MRPEAAWQVSRRLARTDACALALALAFACSLGCSSGCTKPPAGNQPTAASAKSPAAATQVQFIPAGGGPPWNVQVEVARTSDELMRGLMFRRELGESSGMLFIFSGEEIRRFWMHNTYIPLDMLFLDRNRVVVGIVENAVPLDDTSRGPDAPARFVVEVRGGAARQHGLTVGTRAEFHNLEPNVEP
jgi:uncharacterized membrane protein (UPF0127 family)